MMKHETDDRTESILRFNKISRRKNKEKNHFIEIFMNTFRNQRGRLTVRVVRFLVCSILRLRETRTEVLFYCRNISFPFDKIETTISLPLPFT